MKRKKIGIFVIAYEAVTTFDKVIKRIPKDIYDKVDEIFLIDDSSNDNTYYAAMGYKHLNNLDKLTVYRNAKNLGYGGNQKRGYKYAIEQGHDIVVMLHGDAQYAPELLGSILKPLEQDKADMIFGSRMLGNPLKGGMPLYKYWGNKCLTNMQNYLLNMKLTEFHSGYRAYSTKALQKVPFQKCANDFHFDTEILIQFKAAGLRIGEVPIPTYYGSEISRVNVLDYGFNVMKSVMEYKMHQRKHIYREKYDIKKHQRERVARENKTK